MFSGFNRTVLRHCAPILLSLVAIAFTASKAQATLNPGDIAIIAYQSNPDTIAFVALNTIAAGEAIRFTDSGWQAAGSFRANEGGVTYTAPSTLTAGTVVSQTAPFSSNGWSTDNSGVGGSGFDLSGSGDQIIVFQGAGTSPAFLYALTYDSTGWSDATSSNTTAQPPTLVNGTTALFTGTPERAFGYYSGTVSGSAASLLASISNASNWTLSTAVQTLPTWSFDVTSSFPSVTSCSLPAGPFNVGDTPLVTVQLSAAPAAGFPATVSVSSPAFSVSPVNIVISDPNTSGTANVTMGTAGTYTAAATGTNHASGSANSASFTVNAPPTAPTAYAGPDRTLPMSGGSLAIVLTDSTGNDANGLTGLTYAWTPVSGPGIVSWSARTGSVTDPTAPADATVTVNAIGVYTFTLTVTDPTALVATDSVSITVVNAPPIGQYDPPANYYNPARPGGVWLTNGALKTALNGIISARTVRSYDAAKQSLQLLDLDPNNASNLILVYTGVSVAKTWDAGNTWNREHLWPQSRFPSTSDLVNDLFNLRPADPVVNSTRGNDPYGIGANFWDPDHGAPDRGDCARSIFYDAVCYMSEVTLVNGQPGPSNEMGDLAKLLEWHYSDPVNDKERRRNHLIYSNVDNPSYFQGNRNPFIDFPELVWTIFGGSGNNSRLYVGGTNPPTGASAVTVDLGRIIKSASVPSPQNVALTKTGTNPTTYNITTAGSASTATAGPRQAFNGGPQNRSIDCGLVTTTTTAGLKTGTITIDNTDVSSSAAGNGSADGDDVITVNLNVVEHANASFTTPADQNNLTINFGSFTVGSGVQTQNFSLYNLNTSPGFTAALDLDSIGGSGDTLRLSTNLAPLANLAAGSLQNYTASFDTSVAGPFSATYTIVNSDENLSGAAAGVSLILTLTGTVTAPSCVAADANCDNVVTIADIAPFVDMLVNGTAPCGSCTGDVNNDLVRDGRDIQGFVQALVGP